MTAKSDPPQLPIPLISLKQIQTRKKQLTERLVKFVGKQMLADTFFAFVDELHQVLPLPITRKTVEKSVVNLLKKTLTTPLLDATCWRIASNISRLSLQEPVCVWARQTDWEWVAAKIVDIKTRRQGKQLKNQMTFRCLSGTAVGLNIVQYWSFKQTSYFATFKNEQGYGFGFGRSRINSRGEQKGRLLFEHVKQFYNLQCYLLLDPELSEDEPVIAKIGHSSRSMQYNKQLLERRDRAVSPCIKGLPNDPACYLCPYGVDQCVIATHLKSYVVKFCYYCNREWFFDPAELEFSHLCIICADEERKK